MRIHGLITTGFTFAGLCLAFQPPNALAGAAEEIAILEKDVAQLIAEVEEAKAEIKNLNADVELLGTMNELERDRAAVMGIERYGPARYGLTRHAISHHKNRRLITKDSTSSSDKYHLNMEILEDEQVPLAGERMDVEKDLISVREEKADIEMIVRK